MKEINVSYEAGTLPEGVDRQEVDDLIMTQVRHFGGDSVGSGMMMIEPYWRDRQIGVSDESSIKLSNSLRNLLESKEITFEVDVYDPSE